MGGMQNISLWIRDLSTIQFTALVVFLVLAIPFFIIHEVFKPVDLRRGPNGKRYKLPPGPRGLPILRNLYTLREGPKTALRLGQYGDMTTTHPGSRTWILINTNRLAHEIYNKRGSILNGRPQLPMINDIISRRNVQHGTKRPIGQNDEKLCTNFLAGLPWADMQKMQSLESIQLLAEYHLIPEKWYTHHGRYSNSVVCSIALGERVLKTTKKLEDLFAVVAGFVANSPPFNFIDCFPQLTKLPHFLQPGRKQAQILGDATFETYQAYWEPVRERIKAGKGTPSFAQDVLIGDEARYSGTDEDSMYLCLQLIEAGSDTTRTSLNIFSLAAITFPQVYAKARAEVDRVCGPNAERLPMFEDESELPYIHAFIKELMRWRPIFHYPPEHQLTEDLEFEGYHFPKGVNFVLNIPMLRSEPGIYDDPEEFRPERFLDGHEMDILRGNWAFGGGRRVCVGYRLAQRSLFINIARIVYCFDYKAVGTVDPNNFDLYTIEEPFPVVPVPRSSKHMDLISKEAELAGVLQDVLNEKN